MLRSIAGTIFLGVMFVSMEAGAADLYEAFSVLRLEAKPAPDFSLPSVDGKLVKLSSYKGKVVLLGFFQTF